MDAAKKSVRHGWRTPFMAICKISANGKRWRFALFFVKKQKKTLGACQPGRAEKQKPARTRQALAYLPFLAVNRLSRHKTTIMVHPPLRAGGMNHDGIYSTSYDNHERLGPEIRVHNLREGPRTFFREVVE